MRKIYLHLTLLSMLIAVFVPNVAFGLYQSTVPWLMYQHDVAHTGTTTSTAPTSNATLWSYASAGGVVSSPTVVDGQVIFCAGTKIVALDETTGVKLWETVSLSTFAASPTYADGKLYAGGTSGMLYCIDSVAGTKIWEYDASPGQIQTSPAVYGGKVFFGTTDNYLYAVNSTTGLYITRVNLLGPIYSSPAVEGDIVYVGTDNNRLYAVNHTVTPFSLKWFYTTRGRVRTPPVLAYGMVFFNVGTGSSANDHATFALDATSGSLIWKCTFDVYGVENALAVSDNVVYCTPSSGSKVYALRVDAIPGNYTETDPGIRIWSRTLDSYYPTEPIVADSRVFLSDYNKLYALYTSNGAVNWTRDFTSSSGAPIVADGRIFVSEYTRIHCLGTRYPPVTYNYLVHAGGSDFDVMLVIDSTPKNFNTTGLVTEQTLSYMLEGITGTTGMSEITIPKAMMLGPYSVTVDDFAPTLLQTKVDNATHVVLYFTYPHSVHTVAITGSWTVPEYSETVLPWLLVTISLVAFALIRKKQT